MLINRFKRPFLNGCFVLICFLLLGQIFIQNAAAINGAEQTPLLDEKWVKTYGTTDSSIVTNIYKINGTTDMLITGYLDFGDDETYYVLKIASNGSEYWNYEFTQAHTILDLDVVGDLVKIITRESYSSNTKFIFSITTLGFYDGLVDDQSQLNWNTDLGGNAKLTYVPTLPNVLYMTYMHYFKKIPYLLELDASDYSINWNKTYSVGDYLHNFDFMDYSPISNKIYIYSTHATSPVGTFANTLIIASTSQSSTIETIPLGFEEDEKDSNDAHIFLTSDKIYICGRNSTYNSVDNEIDTTSMFIRTLDLSGNSLAQYEYEINSYNPKSIEILEDGKKIIAVGIRYGEENSHLVKNDNTNGVIIEFDYIDDQNTFIKTKEYYYGGKYITSFYDSCYYPETESLYVVGSTMAFHETVKVGMVAKFNHLGLISGSDTNSDGSGANNSNSDILGNLENLFSNSNNWIGLGGTLGVGLLLGIIFASLAKKK